MSAQQPQWVAMGYIKGVFGVKGWVKAAVSTEYTDSLLDYPVWRLRKAQQILHVTLAAGKVVGSELHAKFVGIDDRDAAFALRGHTIEIDRADFGDTAADEYYWADLIGLHVHNRDGVLLGTVCRLLETGAHDVLVVTGDYGEKLIPFVTHYIDSVDTAAGIVADWGADY